MENRSMWSIFSDRRVIWYNIKWHVNNANLRADSVDLIVLMSNREKDKENCGWFKFALQGKVWKNSFDTKGSQAMYVPRSA